MSDNQLDRIEREAFKELKSLELIDLRENVFDENKLDKSAIFSGLPYLNKILLGKKQPSVS